MIIKNKNGTFSATLVLSPEDVWERSRNSTIQQCSDWIIEHGDKLISNDNMMLAFWTAVDVWLEENPIGDSNEIQT